METDSDQRIVEKILQYAALDNKHVLEVGCGNGRISSLMVGRVGQLIAIDPDGKQIKQAQKEVLGADFRIGSGESLEFSDDSFDVIIFTLSLHHQDSKKALMEAKRVLKKEGQILIIEPVAEGEIERVFALVHNENQQKLEAQKAIIECDLYLECSEEFSAKWTFESKEELYQSVFEFYGTPFDRTTALKISEVVGAKLENRPIVLQDRMVIQSLT